MDAHPPPLPTDEPFRHLDEAAVDRVCRECKVLRLDLFGSAVGPRFDPERSDLDFVVAFEPMRPGEYAAAYFTLREALEHLSGRAVDLITEAALENPYLRRQINAEKRSLFSRA
jgi:hypothetical protein